MSPWQTILLITDPIKAWDLWKTLFSKIADLHAPIKKRRIKTTCAPWLSTEIKQLMWERDRLKRIAVITNEESAWVDFKNLKHQVNYKIRVNKKQYYNYFSMIILVNVRIRGRISVVYYLRENLDW